MVLFTAPALPAEIVSLPSLPATTATVRNQHHGAQRLDRVPGQGRRHPDRPGRDLQDQSWRASRRTNNLANPRALRAGSTILVPRGDAASTGQSGPAATADPAPPATAYGQTGDTLGRSRPRTASAFPAW